MRKIEIEIQDEDVISNTAIALAALACEFNAAACGLHREPMPYTVLKGIYEHFSTAYYLLAKSFYAEEVKKSEEEDLPYPV